MRRWLVIGTLFWVLAALITRVGIAPAEVCDRPDDRQVAAAIEGARDWLILNQFDDGTFVYEYDRVSGDLASFGSDEDGYNIIRHAGVVMSLYQLAADGGDETGIPAADRGLAHALDRMIDANDGRAFAPRTGRVDAGASALLLAGLTFRRSATGEATHDELIRDLATFLVAQVGDDGRLLAYFDRRSGRPVPDEVSAYYTGEASWALALTNEAFPDMGLDQPVMAIVDYLALRRTTVERTFPPNDDHWAAYTLDVVSTWDGDALTEDHLAYAHRLGGSWSTQTRFDAQRSGTGVARLTRGEKDTGGFHGTGAEGVTALWRLAGNDGRFTAQSDALEELIACDSGLLVAHQVRSDDPLLEGAWFKGDVTRMDLQQHVMSGLVSARPILAAQDLPDVQTTAATRIARIGLGALLAFATLDHRALRARLTTGRHRRRVATTAGFFCAAILGLVIVLAERLLELARISTTSWFLVAGAWTATMAMWRLARPIPEPASSGDLAAGIVPLAFPTAIEPGLISVAILLAVALSPIDAAIALASAAVALALTLRVNDLVADSDRLASTGPVGPMHHGRKHRLPPRGSLELARTTTVIALFAGAVLLTHGIVGLS